MSSPPPIYSYYSTQTLNSISNLEDLFNAPSSRILLDLPILQRIAPTKPHHATPNKDSKPTTPPRSASLPPNSSPPKRARRNRRIAVSVAGDPDGIPTFMHYGLGGGRFFSWIFHDFALQSGLLLIVPDRPGTGLSDDWDEDVYPNQPPPPGSPGTSANGSTPPPPPKPLPSPALRWHGSFMDYAGIVIQIADTLLGKGTPFAQIGISCGCPYALAVAQMFPERMLPSPIVLFCTWVPPSLPECASYIKMASYVPSSMFVSALKTGNWLTSDPRNVGWIGDIAGTFKWVSQMYNATASAIASAVSTKQHQQSPTLKEETVTETEDSDDKSAMPRRFRILEAVCKLDAVSYTWNSNPTMTAEQAQDVTVRWLRREPPSETYTPPPPPPGTTWESLRNDPNYVNPDSVGAPPLILPPWIHANVFSELEHMTPRRTYRGEGAITDFLNSVEHTAPLGFDYQDVKHPVWAVHGAADSLVAVSSIRPLAKRCGWQLKIVEGQAHNFGDVDVLFEGFVTIKNGVRVGVGMVDPMLSSNGGTYLLDRDSTAEKAASEVSLFEMLRQGPTSHGASVNSNSANNSILTTPPITPTTATEPSQATSI